MNSANLFDQNVEFLRIAFWQIIVAAGPLLAIGLAVGLTIGIIQAATSINEMTLSFVPKLVIVMISFGLLSNFILTQLTDYFGFIFFQFDSCDLRGIVFVHVCFWCVGLFRLSCWFRLFRHGFRFHFCNYII